MKRRDLFRLAATAPVLALPAAVAPLALTTPKLEPPGEWSVPTGPGVTYPESKREWQAAPHLRIFWGRPGDPSGKGHWLSDEELEKSCPNYFAERLAPTLLPAASWMPGGVYSSSHNGHEGPVVFARDGVTQRELTAAERYKSARCWDWNMSSGMKHLMDTPAVPHWIPRPNPFGNIKF